MQILGQGIIFSLDVIEGQLDYAYTYPFNFADGSFGTHRISFAIMEPVRPFVRVIKTKEQEREEKEKLEDEESQEKWKKKKKWSRRKRRS